MLTLLPPDSFRAWQTVVTRLLDQRLTPDEIAWRDAESPPDLFRTLDSSADGSSLQGALPPSSAIRVEQSQVWTPAFRKLAGAATHHRDPRRWEVLYRVAWRLACEDRDLLTNAVDVDVRRLGDWAAQVRRDVHKMHAFVRFRKVATEEAYVAWYRPDHLILPLVRPFFVERFNAMRWSILTPDGSLHWDGRRCLTGPPAGRQDAPDGDALEELWRAYYGAVFNPARTNLRAMRREMPQRHWDLLPETRDIGALVAAASERTSVMVRSRSEATSARPFVPDTRNLAALREASRACTGCELYRHATQTVFGEGPARARVMLVGEQPGDEEDTRGEPFVGPAGRLLDAALEEAGLVRDRVYVTNAVKHFKHEPRGKWRIHKKPDAAEVRACRPWLEAEIRSVTPRVVVCLGATAAQALLGPQARVGTAAAPVASPWAPATLITYHPSAVLRARDDDSRQEMRARLVHDLTLAATLAARES
jgi:DNA polymerase